MSAEARAACCFADDVAPGQPSLATRWRSAAGRFKRDVYALYLSARDPRTPWYARAIVGLVAAYALSPIDLIPDFIPVLGYVDDLIIVPLGVVLGVHLIPAEVLEEARNEADRRLRTRQSSALGLALVVCAWLLVAALVGMAVYRRLAA